MDKKQSVFDLSCIWNSANPLVSRWRYAWFDGRFDNIFSFCCGAARVVLSKHFREVGDDLFCNLIFLKISCAI